MKKREFFKRLFGVGVAAIVAPKALLAEETPQEVVVGDSTTVKRYVSSIEFLDKREIKMTPPLTIQEKVNQLRVGDIVRLYDERYSPGYCDAYTNHIFRSGDNVVGWIFKTIQPFGEIIYKNYTNFTSLPSWYKSK